jgi:hypothetical protein
MTINQTQVNVIQQDKEKQWANFTSSTSTKQLANFWKLYDLIREHALRND